MLPSFIFDVKRLDVFDVNFVSNLQFSMFPYSILIAFPGSSVFKISWVVSMVFIFFTRTFYLTRWNEMTFAVLQHIKRVVWDFCCWMFFMADKKIKKKNHINFKQSLPFRPYHECHFAFSKAKSVFWTILAIICTFTVLFVFEYFGNYLAFWSFLTWQSWSRRPSSMERW